MSGSTPAASPKNLYPHGIRPFSHQPVITVRVSVTSRSSPKSWMPPAGDTGQPGMLATNFEVYSPWRVELANRLEALGSSSEVDRFRVQIRRLVLTKAKRVGADSTRLKNRSKFGYVMDQLAPGRPNLYQSQDGTFRGDCELAAVSWPWKRGSWCLSANSCPRRCIVTRAGIKKHLGQSVRFQDGTLGAINFDSKPFFHRFSLIFHGYEGYGKSRGISFLV